MTLRPLLLPSPCPLPHSPHPSPSPIPRPASTTDTAKASADRAVRPVLGGDAAKLNPIQATFQGDNRYNDQLPDCGSAQYRSRNASSPTRCSRPSKASAAPPGRQDLLSYEIFVRDAKNRLEGERFPDWMMPITQMGSIASYAVMLGAGTSAQPFKTIMDYENWLARGNKLRRCSIPTSPTCAPARGPACCSRALDGQGDPQLDALIKDKPEETLFWGRSPTCLPLQRRRQAASHGRLPHHDRRPADAAYRELRAFITTSTCPPRVRASPRQAA